MRELEILGKNVAEKRGEIIRIVLDGEYRAV